MFPAVKSGVSADWSLPVAPLAGLKGEVIAERVSFFFFFSLHEIWTKTLAVDLPHIQEILVGGGSRSREERKRDGSKKEFLSFSLDSFLPLSLSPLLLLLL